MALELSIFLENKITHFEEITRNLKKENINIRSLLLNNIYHGWGVLNLLVDQPEKAYKVLTEAGNSVVLKEVIALEMKDETGGLDELLIKISRSNKMAILLLEVPDVLEALRRLGTHEISVLPDEIVYGI